MTHQLYQGIAVLTYNNSINVSRGYPIHRSGEPCLSSAHDWQTTTAPNGATSKSWINLDGSPIDSSTAILDDTTLIPYPLEEMPKSNRELRLDVIQSQPTVWVLQSGHPFRGNNGQQTPLLFAPRNESGTFTLQKGDIVDVLLQVHEFSSNSAAFSLARLYTSGANAPISRRYPPIVSTPWLILSTYTDTISAFLAAPPTRHSPPI